MSRVGSKEAIRQFLLANIGRVIDSSELQEAAGGAVQYSRRLRELREQEGWLILSHNDSTDLKPGQYLLSDAPPAKGAIKLAGISAKLRAEVLDRNGFTCQMCRLTPGDIDPSTGRKIRLHLGHIKDKSLVGKRNCRTFAPSVRLQPGREKHHVREALDNLAQEPSEAAGIDEQRAVYDWFRTKFEKKD